MDIWRRGHAWHSGGCQSLSIYVPRPNLKGAKEGGVRLSHEDILPFRGVNMTLVQLALVYDWGQSGNIGQYIASHLCASRPSLLSGVAKGLEYFMGSTSRTGTLRGVGCPLNPLGRISTAALAALRSLSLWPSAEGSRMFYGIRACAHQLRPRFYRHGSPRSHWNLQVASPRNRSPSPERGYRAVESCWRIRLWDVCGRGFHR
ncbi:hypothetical protein BDM02DRAFT_889986 [Thelephora ganbajun]|uniref:Uncharacterized protein n=1 Tax=Thelephora ganbajun TaxID=370292 RepID=A0ACB6Z510_THEGA|nr:hypothetical protein BDM02DRAFT_889986 [Thelephora ganbajun]